MKNCRLISRIFTPLALGLAFAASNGLATGLTAGLAVAAAMWVADPKPC
jgi:hypothetical protein